MSNRWSLKVYSSRDSSTSQPAAVLLKYHNLFLLIPYHVQKLFTAFLEAIPHQFGAFSCREESLFHSFPPGGCRCQTSWIRSTFSVFNISAAIQSSRAAEFQEEQRLFQSFLQCFSICTLELDLSPTREYDTFWATKITTFPWQTESCIMMTDLWYLPDICHYAPLNLYIHVHIDLFIHTYFMYIYILYVSFIICYCCWFSFLLNCKFGSVGFLRLNHKKGGCWWLAVIWHLDDFVSMGLSKYKASK